MLETYLTKTGLNPTEARVLTPLLGGPKTVKGLIREAKLSPSSISKAITSLEAKGFVQSRPIASHKPGRPRMRLQVKDREAILSKIKETAEAELEIAVDTLQTVDNLS